MKIAIFDQTSQPTNRVYFEHRLRMGELLQGYRNHVAFSEIAQFALKSAFRKTNELHTSDVK